MSNLQNLIKELCPNGVEYKKLKDVTIMQRGTSITKKQIVNGNIPVISGGKQPAYYCDKYNREGEVITVAGSGAGAGYVQFWNEHIFVCDAFSVIGNDDLSTKYIYYFLCSIQDKIYATKKGGGVPHVHISSIENFKIPVPPLPVQCEIVRILDSFTLLTAELEDRKKQYEYYRDSLLRFDNKVEYRPLWSVTNWDKKFNTVDKIKQEKIIHYNYYLAAELKNLERTNGTVKILTTNLTDIWTNEDEVADKLSEGEIVCIPWGGNPIVQYYNGKFITGDNRIATSKDKNILNNKYLYYFMQNNIDLIASFYRGSGIKHPNMSKVLDLIIPIPPLNIQKRIVEVLDNFDAICTDLNIGLPAEIEKRQKQYEFYRDALLNYAATGKIILTDRQTDRQTEHN